MIMSTTIPKWTLTLQQKNYAQCDKECDNLVNVFSEQSLASLRAQAEKLFGDMKVRVKMPRVENPSPQSFPQVLPSFEVCTPSVTYPEEVEETLETPMEVEPLDQMKLKYVGLDTCNHNIPFSSREFLSFDEPGPQLKPLPNCPSLDISLGDEKDPKLPIKPQSPSSFRMKVIDHLATHTPPSPHVAYFHPKVLSDVDTGRISIRHCKILKSITLNVLARYDDNALDSLL
ncbi:hypothetical protein Tco_1249923 [Tanacetum coccineum]